MFCSKCGKDVAEGISFCPACGTNVAGASSQAQPNISSLAVNQTAVAQQFQPAFQNQQTYGAYSNESPYYQSKFASFDQNNGSFKGSWNWWAFWFGAFWYLYKGMWGKALLILGLTIVLGGIPGPFFWIYTAIAGNYDYYLLKRKNTQWW